ncbi:unnamed protein product [Caenorhabditis auriculariae]|uniref:Uncharacterized protein n=1 Tax=Caenorhabditis auriculariae TaxID=2777116 RepID=A0A8S1GSV8_9PELO|nr:unnamed protein product [Caenorhabditis auriculariae]
MFLSMRNAVPEESQSLYDKTLLASAVPVQNHPILSGIQYFANSMALILNLFTFCVMMKDKSNWTVFNLKLTLSGYKQEFQSCFYHVMRFFCITVSVNCASTLLVSIFHDGSSFL